MNDMPIEDTDYVTEALRRNCKHIDTLVVERNQGHRWVTCTACMEAFHTREEWAATIDYEDFVPHQWCRLHECLQDSPTHDYIYPDCERHMSDIAIPRSLFDAAIGEET